MSLHEQLSQNREASAQKIPSDIHQVMLDSTKALEKSDLVAKAPKVGETLIQFDLPNHLGQNSRLDQMLLNGPVVLTFYRGGWCPYCNLELRAYQDVLEDIKATGATLVAITPELPDESLSTKEKNELDFTILTDKNSDYARQLGLVFTLPEKLRPIYSSFGIDVEKHNGEGQFDFPLAATFIIGTDKIITSAYVNADYTFRKEPSEIVNELKSLLES